jgi:hypothetical protein
MGPIDVEANPSFIKTMVTSNIRSTAALVGSSTIIADWTPHFQQVLHPGTIPAAQCHFLAVDQPVLALGVCEKDEFVRIHCVE